MVLMIRDDILTSEVVISQVALFNVETVDVFIDEIKWSRIFEWRIFSGERALNKIIFGAW